MLLLLLCDGDDDNNDEVYCRGNMLAKIKLFGKKRRGEAVSKFALFLLLILSRIPVLVPFLRYILCILFCAYR